MRTKVLINDDDTKQRILMRTLLQYQGNTGIETEDGTDVIQQAIDWRPGIILQNFPCQTGRGIKPPE